MSSKVTSSISRKVQVNRLPQEGLAFTIEADEEARDALARKHDLLSVERFSAELLVRPWKRDGARVIGRVQANVVQSCVVTLEPVKGNIDEDVSATFVPEGSHLADADIEGGEIVIDAEAEDPPEPFSGDRIDIGALAEQYFALGIGPYPRKEGVELEPPAGEEPEEAAPGPLQEALKKLRGNG